MVNSWPVAGEDGFALDLTAIKRIGVDPLKVPVMKAACKRNLFPESEKDIEMVGESIKDVAIANFVLLDNMQNPNHVSLNHVYSKLVESIKPKVSFDYEERKRCKKCY
ncbi:MAG: hypothetical protein ACXVI7_08720 [Halobacteriota archaeon]